MLNLSAFLSLFSKLFTKCSGLQENSIRPQRGVYGDRESTWLNGTQFKAFGKSKRFVAVLFFVISIFIFTWMTMLHETERISWNLPWYFEMNWVKSMRSWSFFSISPLALATKKTVSGRKLGIWALMLSTVAVTVLTRRGRRKRKIAHTCIRLIYTRQTDEITHQGHTSCHHPDPYCHLPPSGLCGPHVDFSCHLLWSLWTQPLVAVSGGLTWGWEATEIRKTSQISVV